MKKMVCSQQKNKSMVQEIRHCTDTCVATIEEPLGSPQVLGGVYVATIEEPLGSPQGLGEV
jgi:hypothetical protein